MCSRTGDAADAATEAGTASSAGMNSAAEEPTLADPLSIGALTIPNRVVVAPMAG
jgi:hypothetical protein